MQQEDGILKLLEGKVDFIVLAGSSIFTTIEQDVIRVTHRDGLYNLIRKGRDLEKTVLARAVHWYLEDRILVYHNRTVVFV